MRPEPESPPTEARTRGRCPLCGKPAAHSFRPFCSKRCADVDLHRWLTSRYAIPAAEEDAISSDVDEGER